MKQVDVDIDKPPLVSICCITYNHEEYIRDAIEGFLMQKVNFPIEIIIHDDASTDNTQEIIRKYAKKDDRIIPILRKENIKSKGVPVFPITFEKARGKYITMCEGDDYWTDPLKLQKQVSFLEDNSDYVMSFHDAKIIDENDKLISVSKIAKKSAKRNYTQEEVIQGKLMPTMSVVFRNNVLNQYTTAMRGIVNGDRFLFSLLGQHGKAHYAQPVKPAVYRAHGGGVWSNKNIISQKKDGVKTYQALLESVEPEFKPLIRSELIYRLISLSVEYLKSGSFQKFNEISQLIKHTLQLNWVNTKYLIKNFTAKTIHKLTENK